MSLFHLFPSASSTCSKPLGSRDCTSNRTHGYCRVVEAILSALERMYLWYTRQRFGCRRLFKSTRSKISLAHEMFKIRETVTVQTVSMSRDSSLRDTVLGSDWRSSATSFNKCIPTAISSKVGCGRQCYWKCSWRSVGWWLPHPRWHGFTHTHTHTHTCSFCCPHACIVRNGRVNCRSKLCLLNKTLDNFLYAGALNVVSGKDNKQHGDRGFETNLS